MPEYLKKESKKEEQTCTEYGTSKSNGVTQRAKKTVMKGQPKEPEPFTRAIYKLWPVVDLRFGVFERFGSDIIFADAVLL